MGQCPHVLALASYGTINLPRTAEDARIWNGRKWQDMKSSPNFIMPKEQAKMIFFIFFYFIFLKIISTYGIYCFEL